MDKVQMSTDAKLAPASKPPFGPKANKWMPSFGEDPRGPAVLWAVPPLQCAPHVAACERGKQAPVGVSEGFSDSLARILGWTPFNALFVIR